MSFSKVRKIRINKFDKLWSKLVRKRDGACLYCGKRDYLAAHHFIRRSIKSTRLLVSNGVTLCPAHHTFNHEFSAHRTPEAFKRWFTKNYSDRVKDLKKRERIMMTEREAIKEFQETYDL